MATHTLAVSEDADDVTLPAASRILYVVSGEVEVGGTILGANQATHVDGACAIRARGTARLWRWELHAGSEPPPAAMLACPIDLPAAECLMRCDRVDFPPGGVAYTHTHQGPGIRMLLRGSFRVEVDGREQRIAPGEAWFERGPDAVYAEASREEPTSFIRVLVLPRALLGKSSIRYVKPEDQARPKTQTYTVFVDQPITT
jgi:hypothetical protein